MATWTRALRGVLVWAVFGGSAGGSATALGSGTRPSLVETAAGAELAEPPELAPTEAEPPGLATDEAEAVPAVPPPAASSTKLTWTAADALTFTVASMGEEDRGSRRAGGIAQLAWGGALLASGVGLRLTEDGREPQQLAATVFMPAGAGLMVSGLLALLTRSPTEKLVASELFVAGRRDGWTPEQVEALAHRAEAAAPRARKTRLVTGGVLTGVSAGLAATGAALLAIELQDDAPSSPRAVAVAQLTTTGVALLVQGIVKLATPSALERNAQWLQKHRRERASPGSR